MANKQLQETEDFIKCVNCNTFYKWGKKKDIPATMQNEEICKKCYRTGKFSTCIKCRDIFHKDNAAKTDPALCFECGENE